MRPIARVGDKHLCPVHGPNAIATGSPAMADGRPIARVGDQCLCGCLIVTGDPRASIDGRPVATIGSQTTLGGVIVEGAPTHRMA